MFELFVENPLYFMAILVCIGIFVNSYISYITSSYYKVTKHFYFDIYTDKGKYGEYLIYKHLKKMEADGAKFLFNLYIPNSSGGTTEIDVLIISPKGIFVFESKNYSGWIFGSENQKNWYQTLSGRDRTCCKEKFYNPVRQNRAHIEALKKFLQVNVPMWSIIVFSERCTLKSIEITSNDVAVINRDKLGREVASIYNKTTINFLRENEISSIYDKLYPYTQVSEDIKRQHVKNIREMDNDKKYRIQNEFKKKEKLRNETQECPWCSGKLVLRTAKKGINIGNQFYGCSNYPKCSYIKNLAKDSTASNIEYEKDDFLDNIINNDAM